MKARGNTKVIINKVTEIQTLIGNAKSAYQNDGGHNRVDRAETVQSNLDKAFQLCLEIRGMYDPT